MELKLRRDQNIIGYLTEKHRKSYMDAESLIYLIKDLYNDLQPIGIIDNRPITRGQKKILIRHVARNILRLARTDDLFLLETISTEITFPLFEVMESIKHQLS